jgi:hypothetical protein
MVLAFAGDSTITSAMPVEEVVFWAMIIWAI